MNESKCIGISFFQALRVIIQRHEDPPYGRYGLKAYLSDNALAELAVYNYSRRYSGEFLGPYRALRSVWSMR